VLLTLGVVDVEPVERAILSELRVFPLPGTVLFPGTVIPLHIFEPRYFQMINDAMGSDEIIAITMIQPGHDPDGSPPVCPIACLGKIVHSEALPENKFNILLHGIQRVRLVEEVTASTNYRRFRSELIAKPNEDALQEAVDELTRLQSCVLSLQSLVQESDAQLAEVLRSTPDPVQLADILSAVLINEPLARQDVLETVELKGRLTKLIDVMTEVMVNVTESQTAQVSSGKLN
jgi:Lon protease-like protein